MAVPVQPRDSQTLEPDRSTGFWLTIGGRSPSGCLAGHVPARRRVLRLGQDRLHDPLSMTLSPANVGSSCSTHEALGESGANSSTG